MAVYESFDEKLHFFEQTVEDNSNDKELHDACNSYPTLLVQHPEVYTIVLEHLDNKKRVREVLATLSVEEREAYSIEWSICDDILFGAMRLAKSNPTLDNPSDLRKLLGLMIDAPTIRKVAGLLEDGQTVFFDLLLGECYKYLDAWCWSRPKEIVKVDPSGNGHHATRGLYMFDIAMTVASSLYDNHIFPEDDEQEE